MKNRRWEGREEDAGDWYLVKQDGEIIAEIACLDGIEQLMILHQVAAALEKVFRKGLSTVVTGLAQGLSDLKEEAWADIEKLREEGGLRLHGASDPDTN